MAIRCPECSTPAVAGHRFCGHCGALVTARPDDVVAPDPPVDEVPTREVPAPALPGWNVDGDRAAVVVDEAPRRAASDAPGQHVGTTVEGPQAPARAQGLRARVTASPGPVALLAVLVALVGFGRVTSAVPDGAGGAAFASPLASGGANQSQTQLPEFTRGLVWQFDGAPRQDVLSPLPLAAPTMDERRIVTVVPDGVVIHDRATGAVRRIDVPTSGATAARILPGGAIVVLAQRDAWFLDEGGVLARAGEREIADVTPVVVGDGVVVQTELGGLVLLTLDGVLVEATELRGVTASAEGAAVPRFELGVHAVDDQALWVGSRDRETDQAGLWRLDRRTLEPLLRLPLGTPDLPTILPVGDGSVVVAHDDLVVHVGQDGSISWVVRVGTDAELLGVDDGRVLVRHVDGRDVLEISRGQVVARATTVLLDGPRSQVAGGEVLVNDDEQLQSMRIFDATVARRLEGRPLSVAGQDDGTIAWVTLGVDGAPVLRVQPTPDRAATATALDAIDLPLPIDRSCAIAPAGDRVVWHDGVHLREIDLAGGEQRARIAAGSSGGSSIVVGDVRGVTAAMLVDVRGVIRRYSRGLGDLDVMAVGDDPVLGLGLDEELVVAAGGTGRIAILGATDGYVRALEATGATRWLVRIRGAVASAPVVRGDLAAIRQVDGGVALIRDGRFVADIGADPRSLDAPLVDARGVVLRSGHAVTAAFPAGEVAWTTPDVATLPGLASDGEVVVARRTDGLVGLDRQTGSVLWSVTTTDGAGFATTPLSVPTIAGEHVVVALHDVLLVLDRATGVTVDRREDAGDFAGPLVATSAGIVACTAAGDLRLVG